MPTGVQKNTHNANTFKPYDPAEVLGETAPTTPKPAKGNKCGAFGVILLAVIAIAVTAILTPIATSAVAGLIGPGLAATTVGAATAAAAGSIVSQGVGVATGIQDKFSWKAVGMSALTATLSGGRSGNFLLDAASAAVTNAMIQGIGVATGLQDKFSWAGVAAAAISAGVTSAVGGKLPSLAQNNSIGNHLRHFGANAAGGIARAASYSVIQGTSFGDNLMGALPDVVGTTVGNALVHGVSVPRPQRGIQVNQAALQRAVDRAFPSPAGSGLSSHALVAPGTTAAGAMEPLAVAGGGKTSGDPGARPVGSGGAQAAAAEATAAAAGEEPPIVVTGSRATPFTGTRTSFAQGNITYTGFVFGFGGGTTDQILAELAFEHLPHNPTVVAQQLIAENPLSLTRRLELATALIRDNAPLWGLEQDFAETVQLLQAELDSRAGRISEIDALAARNEWDVVSAGMNLDVFTAGYRLTFGGEVTWGNGITIAASAAGPLGKVVGNFVQPAIGWASRFLSPAAERAMPLRGLGANVNRTVDFAPKQLQAKFKHAADFGVDGTFNKQNAARYEAALQAHVSADATQVIPGTYRGKSITHFVDPSSGLNVMRGPDGGFVSGWKLSAAQLENVLRNGKLGGF